MKHIIRLNRSQNWPRAYSYKEARVNSPSPRPVDGKDVWLKNWRRIGEGKPRQSVLNTQP